MKPTVQAIILADRVYQDKSNKFIIVGVFSVQFFKAAAKPGRAERSLLEIQDTGNPWVYINLTNVKEETPLELRFESLSTGLVHFSTKFKVNSNDPLVSAEISLPVPRLPNIEGSYILDLLYEETSIGTHRVKIAELRNDSK